MRLGAWLDAGMSAGEVVEVGRRLEQAGAADPRVDSLWLSEAYVGRDAVTLAAAVAQATTSARIATAIVNPFTRHPAVLAMTALTMNELAPGRFVLGVGTGESHWMAALGHPFTKPVTVMRECAREIRRVVAGEPVEAGGHRVQTIIRDPDRHLVLHLAAIGPRMCALAGSEFDGCILPAASPTLVARAVADIRAGEREAGRPPGSCESVATLLFAAGPDNEMLRARMRRKLGLLLTGPGAAALLERGGVDPEHAVRFHGEIEELGLRAALTRLPDEVLDAFAIVGPIDRCAEVLQSFAGTTLDVAALLCEPDQVDNLLALARIVA